MCLSYSVSEIHSDKNVQVTTHDDISRTEHKANSQHDLHRKKNDSNVSTCDRATFQSHDNNFSDLVEKDIAETQENQDNSSNHDSKLKYVVTGLHACGDLTPTLIRMFAECSDLTGLAAVGCCYMKLNQSDRY